MNRSFQEYFLGHSNLIFLVCFIL